MRVASQPPLVSEATARVPPFAGGAVFAALLSVVAGSCQVFLSLSGSVFLLAIGGMAGMTAPAAGSGGAVCPSASAGGAVVFFCVRLRRLRGLGAFVPFDLCGWGSHCWCCDCDACLSWWSACSSTVHGVPSVPGAPGVPGMPGVPGGPLFALSGSSCSSGCCRRSASGGFDWRDVAQVAISIAYGLFSSVGKFYRSSSVRGSGPGSSTRFWSLLHWRRLSVVPAAWLTAVSLACGLAFAVSLDGGGLPRGY